GRGGKRRPVRPASEPAGPNLTNLGKLYWPADGITKGDLIDYYREVASVILPYLKDRPQSLHRHPSGIDGKSFFHKDHGDQAPARPANSAAAASAISTARSSGST
ncbi:MAG: hypothetical protein KY463_05935, partial [Actinobacteria bacterium]|nr:hypothetical protein [Actinomycetota bacterium]